MIRTKLLILFLPIVAVFFNCGYNVDRSIFVDFAIFKSSPLWPLAKATMLEDTSRMQRLIKRKYRATIDSPNGEYGETLLMLAAKHRLSASTEILLKNGADPNFQNQHDGSTPVMYACGFGRNYDRGTSTLELLLRYGGNPSHSIGGHTPNDCKKRNTPLQLAATCCLGQVKVLIAFGADVDYINECLGSALSSALSGVSESAEITRFLLFEAGVNLNIPIVETLQGDTLYIENALRDWRFDLDSEEYRVKMEIVSYLKLKGRDYHSAPIPKHIRERYPEDYLSAY